MKKNKESQVHTSDKSITLTPESELKQKLLIAKCEQILVHKNKKEVIEKILEIVKNTTSHAC